MADEHRDIAARGHLVDPRHVGGEAVPRRGSGVGVQAPEALEADLEGDDPGAAVADHIGGDALQDLEGHLRIAQHREVVVAVDVDETRAHRKAGRVELGAAALGDGPDAGDAVAAHAHIGARAGRTGPVVHGAPPDHQIVRTRHGGCPPAPRIASTSGERADDTSRPVARQAATSWGTGPVCFPIHYPGWRRPGGSSRSPAEGSPSEK